MARDYYETLGVTPQAGEGEIKKAFRSLAMQYHPDRNQGDKSAEDRFKEINEAYAVLSDPDKRAHYDRFGTAPGAGGAGGFEPGFGSLFEDIFENFLGGGRGGRRSRAARGEDLQYELKITLEEAAAGLETKIQIPRLETCATCGGSGAEPGTRKAPCEACGGRGEVRMSHGFLTVARPCPKCMGEGQLNKSPCKGCRGEGRQRAERLLSVRIPAGIDDGMQLRLNGEGAGGVNGGPPGDLYVLVRLREHALFARNGSDLHCELPVSFAQLALGTELEVPVLGGTAKLKVPAGSQPGQILKLRGKGMPHLRERGHGDACYRLLLEVPHKLNARQREALEAFEAASSNERGPLATSFLERMKKLLG
ncbi:MAG TPA: molecular chaperone DnaJ [Methylomirabilota bacterium]|nr:molecular chaperone DnaJ [Methylomirabilota bacterium]